MISAIVLSLAPVACPAPGPDHWATPAAADAIATIDRTFKEYQLDAHLPGMVYGVVVNGCLAHVQALGVQDLETSRPVTADSLFRIASMTKAFTALSILNLRDAGKLALDAPAETYLPELKAWSYPTADSRRIRVRDLLNHTAGFVTDDPWGDRQTPLPEAEFTELLREGVPFTRAPGTAMEYSNLGYAMLGRIVVNVAKQPYKDYVERTLLRPLGMTSSGFVVDEAPSERRALGYRWEDDQWRLEPTLAHGAFGAMGGLQTTANEYARYVAWLLSAWPARDGVDSGPVKRATVRELAEGSNFPRLRQRFGQSGANACRQASAYGMGMIVAADCDLGLTLSHSGGYPGYGSHVLLLTDYGVGVFAFANRTYAGPMAPVWDAAVALHKAGLLKGRTLPVSDALAAAYRAAGTIYARGDINAAADMLAMNFVLDRAPEGRARDLDRVRKEVGECNTSTPLTATGQHSGEFTWDCAHGRVKGSLLLAPTIPPRIQELKIAPAAR
ncbi:MAG TPA: serine hydrolase domain-containing protein [Vicinamibacteria bacterium]|nr:serine hydrolase domain-containing protein [Vicinamibacteria bacterium]